MTHPSSPPAPMTAERLYEVREQYRSGRWGDGLPRELFGHIDALTARVAELERERQYTCEQHRDEVRKGERCVWCELAAARGAFDLSESERQRLAGRINDTEARKVEDGGVERAINLLSAKSAIGKCSADNGNYHCPVTINEIDDAVDLLTRLSAALKEAGQRASDHLRASEILNRHCVRLEARAQAAEAKLESARRDALEEAASECLILERDDAIDCPSGPAWKWYGKSRDHAAARIRAIQTSDRHD